MFAGAQMSWKIESRLAQERRWPPCATVRPADSAFVRRRGCPRRRLFCRRWARLTALGNPIDP